ncbi:hypothetical protein [Chitinophaga pinensis]|uniref:PorT family protein n=1 Tax=Chitinophaga pinensis TaxID=79329 RepID=A0A5C6LPC1_9BACT|nr:hypothetical protein [Chitinophaga pinensis]TWV97435.1 hypothetical protein FEF09_21525 [Chitinophaga pinensis]
MEKAIYWLAFSTTFLIMHHSFAQSRIDIGIKAGLSIPNLTSGDGENPISSGYGSRLGPDAAIHVEFIFLNISLFSHNWNTLHKEVKKMGIRLLPYLRKWKLYSRRDRHRNICMRIIKVRRSLIT